MMNPEDIIAALQLEPHPEGGWYRETYRAKAVGIERATSTAIYYLLKAGERSHWHRVTDANEIGIGMQGRHCGHRYLLTARLNFSSG